jgi:hypothetical protein
MAEKAHDPLSDLLRVADERTKAFTISTRVNSPRNNDAAIVARVD